jgi:hypothetical protein
MKRRDDGKPLHSTRGQCQFRTRHARRDRAEPAKTPRTSCCATAGAPREQRQATQSQRQQTPTTHTILAHDGASVHHFSGLVAFSARHRTALYGTMTANHCTARRRTAHTGKMQLHKKISVQGTVLKSFWGEPRQATQSQRQQTPKTHTILAHDGSGTRRLVAFSARHKTALNGTMTANHCTVRRRTAHIGKKRHQKTAHNAAQVHSLPQDCAASSLHSLPQNWNRRGAPS